jgi:glycosyltransferase involved in cell wall biosynthesis
MSCVLYITLNGITDHIGRSQVAPYLLGLSRLGHDIHLLSAEKPGRDEAVEEYRRIFGQAGIRWTIVPYRNRPPLLSTLYVLANMYRAARKIVQTEHVTMTHCRSYLPLELGSRLKRRFGIKYLADFRDFWADGGIETKRGKFIYRWFLKRESETLGPADHIVALTDRAVSLLTERYPAAAGGRQGYTVIPCCADFDHFDPSKVREERVAGRRASLGIPEGSTVLLYLGSLGVDYLLPQMMALFRELREIDASAIFLFLANNAEEAVAREAATAGIPAEAIRFASVGRDEIPEYIALAHLSVVFIRQSVAKSGCSPTKVAELFAMNVPIVANTGFGDIDAIVSLERNGSALVKDFSPQSLREALEQVLRSSASRAPIRERNEEYRVEEAVRRYDAIYRKLGCVPDSGRQGSR